MRSLLSMFGALVLLLFTGCQGTSDYINPYDENPAYWEYQGAPVLLIGGSGEDNLFQAPDLETELDRLQQAGGNYVRCTMSSRDAGNVWPFAKDPAGALYDLNKPNPEYWKRFQRFLSLTSRRNIIAQIELWATFDFYRDPWDRNPFNPKNNVNYTSEESGLPEKVTTHPTRTDNPFFWSVPAEHNNGVVLSYQQKFIDALLSYSLRYGNVLYCMDNETSVTPEWGAYWARYVREHARERNVPVQTTEMWDAWDLANAMHSNTFDHPEIYTFVDVSQNNHQTGQTHWDNAQRQRERIRTSGRLRPLNNVKVYGADTGRYGSDRDGMARMWRNVWGGMASSRFHRPESGLGLSGKARANIRSLRMITGRINIFQSQPRNDLLGDREENEAYCLSESGTKFAVFFPAGGDVSLQVAGENAGQEWQIRWLDILNSRWLATETVPGGATLRLTAPSDGMWAVSVQPGQ